MPPQIILGVSYHLTLEGMSRNGIGFAGVLSVVFSSVFQAPRIKLTHGPTIKHLLNELMNTGQTRE